MRVLSLFDWISCARVALKRAWIPVEVYFASEIDKYAMQVSQKNYRDIIDIWDVRHVRCKSLKSDNAETSKLLMWKCYRLEDAYTQRKIDDIDLLIWGSPCQDLSVAKKDRKGLNGERSGLFWEYVRILKEVNPKWFILENVASMSKESRDTISDVLGVKPIMIDAALVSAQRRKRLFRTNIPWVIQPADRNILLNEIIEDAETEKDKSYAITATYARACPRDYFLKSSRQLVYVKQRARWFNKWWKHYEKSPPITSNSWEQNNKLFRNWLLMKLTPTECERLQWLPDNYTEGISNTQRYKCLGNAFNVDVVAHILSFIPQDA